MVLKEEIINDDKYTEFLIFLFKEKDINLILFHILSFILGFNISEISKIKINNFSNITIKWNLSNVQRKIIKPFKKIFTSDIKKNSLNSTDYLFYFSKSKNY